MPVPDFVIKALSEWTGDDEDVIRHDLGLQDVVWCDEDYFGYLVEGDRSGTLTVTAIQLRELEPPYPKIAPRVVRSLTLEGKAVRVHLRGIEIRVDEADEQVIIEGSKLIPLERVFALELRPGGPCVRWPKRRRDK